MWSPDDAIAHRRDPGRRRVGLVQRYGPALGSGSCFVPRPGSTCKQPKLEILHLRTQCVDWTLGFIAIALLVAGLVGQAFEMRRIRVAQSGDEMGSPSVFTHRANFKWYAVIGAGIIIWYVAERS